MRDLVEGFFQAAVAGRGRSSVLAPLQWILFVLTIGLIGTLYKGVPTWIAGVLLILIVVLVLFCLAAYVYFAKADPDTLRSETYSLRKLEIQKGLIGDDRSGLMSPKKARAIEVERIPQIGPGTPDEK